jgi:LemA protein
MNRTRPASFVPVLTAALLLAACGVNSIPNAEDEAKAKWADLEAAYRQRAGILARLPGQAQAAWRKEIAAARAAAPGARLGPGQLTDEAAVRRFAAAQRQVTDLLDALRVTVPDPPGPEADAAWRDMVRNIERTEAQVTNARAAFRRAVRDHNLRIRKFPSVIAARTVYQSRPMAAP